MFFLSFFLTLLSLSYVTQGHLHGFCFRDLGYPHVPAMSARLDESEEVLYAEITQPLDHFNHTDSRTWSMRYHKNPRYFKENGPIFIMIGGEGEIQKPWLQAGLMYDTASYHGGMMYQTEHRYYGWSIPTENSSLENLQYLNAGQALADLAFFIVSMKKEDARLRDSPVILFGGSYAGNLAAWFKLRYPHLVLGALASSAPVLAKTDFHEFLDVVTQSLGKYSKQCTTKIKLAFDAIEELLRRESGPEASECPCQLPNMKFPNGLAFFTYILVENLAKVVQQNTFVFGIATLCDTMTATYDSSALAELAHYVLSNYKSCVNTYNYAAHIRWLKNDSWASEATRGSRQWTYQLCREFGYHHTSNSTKSIFGPNLPLKFFINVCKDFLDKHYDEEVMNSRVETTNLMFGGLNPKVENVIFSNGDLDPWHALSIIEDLNESSPAILIDDVSHCSDLHRDTENDSFNLLWARAQISWIIADWLQTHRIVSSAKESWQSCRFINPLFS